MCAKVRERQDRVSKPTRMVLRVYLEPILRRPLGFPISQAMLVLSPFVPMGSHVPLLPGSWEQRIMAVQKWSVSPTSESVGP